MGTGVSIDGLLEQRGTHRVDSGGSHADALRRLEVSKLLAKNFEGFDEVRTHLLHPSDFRSIRNPSKQVKSSLNLMTDLGWIKSTGSNTFCFADDIGSEVRWYLQGGWLEEYVYCAHLEAGVDEAIYAQRVEWQLGEVTGRNEIDVIARRGDVLSFTSCKTLRPEQRVGNTKILTEFLSETSYWDTHFSDNKGCALLVVTADFVDEIHMNKIRYPVVLARASILHVDAVGLEDLQWEKLVAKVDAHWDTQ